MASELPKSLLPVTTRFHLGNTITLEQRAFLNTFGFVHFSAVASTEEVATISTELDGIATRWEHENRQTVHGIPLFWGRDAMKEPFLQRFAFVSKNSEYISRFVKDARFEPVRQLIGTDARVGEDEKDGVVVNRYLNTQGSTHRKLGWHTDGLRDLFYGRMPQPMLNIGLHLDACDAQNGGLRLIPGTHHQGFWQMCFHKAYFVAHRPDPREHCVETQPGDLTIHDGRLWHRVAQSRHHGSQSLRRTMYVPYLTGPYEPKDESSKTPGYHTLGRIMRAVRDYLFVPRA